jgi:hypothetical protein
MIDPLATDTAPGRAKQAMPRGAPGDATAVITFVIPVRHPDNARDWALLKSNLTQTVASISAQRHPGWRAVVVANHGADLPALPVGFEVVRVDFPPNPRHDFDGQDKEAVYESFRLDKGRRVLAGMLAARDTRFYMIVDDDDFVSNRLVGFAAANATKPGWYIASGYVWTPGGTMVFDQPNFHDHCGTSLIVSADLYRLPASPQEASDAWIASLLGSHRGVAELLLARTGTSLEPLPFHGAVYRVGHAGAHSGSGNMLRMYFLSGAAWRRPHRLVKNLRRLRTLDRGLAEEFFATPAAGGGNLESGHG